MIAITDAFDKIAELQPGKIVFLEGLLWDRHIPEIFEIIDRTGIPADVYYVANNVTNNDRDIFKRVNLRKYDGTAYLREISTFYNSCATIKETPKLSRRVKKNIIAEWNIQRSKLTADPESLKLLTYKSCNVGHGILSSYYTYDRDLTFDPRKCAAKIKQDFINACGIYEVSVGIIQRYSDAVFCTFNGRLKYCRPIVDAVISCKNQLFFHERGSTKEKYHFSCHSPHDQESIRKKLAEIYQQHPGEYSSGADFFRRRRAGDGISWPSFTVNQKTSSEAPWRSLARPLCAYFSSSDDEFLSVPGFLSSEVFSNQIDAVEALLNGMQRIGGSVVVRMHPNQENIDPQTMQRWRALASKGAVVIPPASEMSSYELLEESDFVCVYISTMGTEALYWRKPVLFLGNATICGVGEVKAVTSRRELERRIRERTWGYDTHQARNLALVFGYYNLNFGTTYQRYRPIDYFSGEIGGYRVELPDEHRLFTVCRRIKRAAIRVLMRATDL